MRVSEVVNPGAPLEGEQSLPDRLIVFGCVVAQRPPFTDSTLTTFTPMSFTVTWPPPAEVTMRTGYWLVFLNAKSIAPSNTVASRPAGYLEI